MPVSNYVSDSRCLRVLRRFARTSRAGAAAALLVVVGCDNANLTCPLLPDRTGLTVQLSAAPVGAFTVEVLLAAPPPVPSYVYICDGGVTCRGVSAVFFPGLVPSFVAVRVTTTVGTRTTNRERVTYVDAYPNGRACEPRSTTGTVLVPLPL